MKKFLVLLGISALLAAGVDMLHGQNNGDVHRGYIHATEFVLILCFLSTLTLQAYKQLSRKLELSGWCASLFLSVASVLLGFTFFGLSGGSYHGDGGPIALAFLIFGVCGIVGALFTLAGRLMESFRRKHQDSQ